MQSHGIGAGPHLLAKHHVEISEHSPRDAGLVHVHGAHAVVTPLWGEPGYLLALPMHAQGDALGSVVGADDGLAPLIAKLEGAEPIGLACGEHGAPLLTVVTHLRNAEGAHRHPEVGQQAAEPQGEYHARSASEISKEIKRMEEQMFQHARDLEFEQAAALRDQIQRLRGELIES